MGRRSSIKTLPAEIKREVDRLLAEGRFTLDQIVSHLRNLGVTVSRSATGRYAREFGEISSQMREAREVATSFAQELGAIPDNDMGRTLVEMLHHLIFKQILAQSRSEDPDVSTKDLMQLAKALKDAAGTNKLSVDLELKIRDEVEKQTKAAVVKATEIVAKERGLSSDTISAIKAQILGVKVGA
jgi:DNA-binding transcriptional ArsR family regulator